MSGQLNNPYVRISDPLRALNLGTKADVSPSPFQYLTAFKNPGPNLQGGIVASMPAGSFAGSLINVRPSRARPCLRRPPLRSRTNQLPQQSYLADKLGRKYCICVSGCLW